VPQSAWFFFREFLRHPKLVGSIIPTSSYAIRATLKPVNWASCRTIVEYGPGTGAFTRHILRLARPDCRIVLVEPNPDFVEFLTVSLPDPRLTVIEGSAADIGQILSDLGIDGADYVLSGLPFSMIDAGVANRIVEETGKALSPGGQFLVYQYSLFALPMLKRVFADVRHRRAWLCIPPARLMFARGPRSGPGN